MASNESVSCRMATLIPANGVLFNYAAVAPPPSKDYCQVVVTNEQVIFRVWKITIRQNARVTPQETKDSHEDFLYDDRSHSEMTRVFGKPVLDYILALAQGHIDYLPRLATPLLIHIIRFLDLEDVSRLACVSKQFQELCSSDELWEIIYLDHSETPITEQLQSLAEAIGWRKLFFTNKLQVQMQLRRHARQMTSQPEKSSKEIIPSASEEDLGDWRLTTASGLVTPEH